jgi:glycosyltransferase involved in cell wall biosynthesis
MIGRPCVSVVVPCYNEEAGLPALAETLRSVQAQLAERYQLHFLFVDDGSTDRTWKLLGRLFRPWANCTLLRHDRNRGITAATLTGMRHADTETVCAIDSDGSYDLHELGHMIPLLADRVDVVTASPYHPHGGVRHIPAWRLWLSRASSALYRRVLHQKLFTYTSCFRVYRRGVVENLRVTETGFQGIAEILARLDLQGCKIVEYPTVLDVRKFGQSKMKVLRTIAGHLRLLGRLLLLRLFKAGGAAAVPLHTPAVEGPPV